MPLREFEDQAGSTWMVWDTAPPNSAGVVGDYRNGWLTFDNGTERRRLTPVPPNWADLPPERLTLLLRVATAIGARDTAKLTHLENERRVAERREADRRQEQRRREDRRQANAEARTRTPGEVPPRPNAR